MSSGWRSASSWTQVGWLSESATDVGGDQSMSHHVGRRAIFDVEDRERGSAPVSEEQIVLSIEVEVEVAARGAPIARRESRLSRSHQRAAQSVGHEDIDRSITRDHEGDRILESDVRGGRNRVRNRETPSRSGRQGRHHVDHGSNF